MASLTDGWGPWGYGGTYREQVIALLKKKAEGREIVVEEEAPEEGQVLDLMEALEASLAEAKKGGSKGSGTRKHSSTAKKSTRASKSSKSSRSRQRKSA